MPSPTMHWQTAAVGIVLSALVLYPLLTHVWFGWRRKADDMTNAMTERAKRIYLEAFQGISEFTDVEEQFWSFYKTWYGRRFYIVPAVLIGLITACQTYLLAETGLSFFSASNNIAAAAGGYLKLPATAAAGVAGAYMFVVWDVISRATRRDLPPRDIMGGALRLGLAIPVGYAFSAIAAPEVGPFMAFAAGVFPVETLATVLRRLANKKLDLEVGADTAPDQVVQLSGVDKPTADRLEEADITTISQLAYCDPVQLSMRTNLALEYLADLVSQALAWTYLRDYVDTIRPLGIRGAWEIRDLWNDLNGPDQAAKRRAQAVIDQTASAMNAVAASRNAAASAKGQPGTAASVTAESLEFVFEEIADDSYTTFLYEFTGGAGPGAAAPAAPAGPEAVPGPSALAPADPAVRP